MKRSRILLLFGVAALFIYSVSSLGEKAVNLSISGNLLGGQESSASSSAGVRQLFFVYDNAKVEALKSVPVSQTTVSAKDILDWAGRTHALLTARPLHPAVAGQMYASVAVVQRDFTTLSAQTAGMPAGDIAPVSRKVLCVFFPADCAGITVPEPDAYTAALTDVVFARWQQRLSGMAGNTLVYNGSGSWKPVADVSASLPMASVWSADPSDTVPEPFSPGSAEDIAGLLAVTGGMQAETDAQKKAAVQWLTGDPALVRWMRAADSALDASHAQLWTVLDTRVGLSVALSDAQISAWRVKFQYGTQRPPLRDTAIKPLVASPDSSSYISADAAMSAAAEALLKIALPGQTDQWTALLDDATTAEVRAGIAFPEDVQQGIVLGKAVAEKVGKRL